MAETYYRESVGNASYYPGGSTDPVRSNAPYTPVTIISPGGRSNVPIWGVVALVLVVLWFEQQRRRRGKR